ncbi:MAG: hypothetical protein HYX72_13300 [Acidobacteria bacterium]|nr:hypothetical protein [Acidobacteriota bacterium]
MSALIMPILVFAYSAGPPDAHTGGFGEPTCTECHGTRANTNPGSVVIQLPASYTSGATYSITVRITDATARRWGFQLSARTADGRQAGTLSPGSDRFTQIANAAVSGPLSNPSVQYIEHTSTGTRAGLVGPINFTFNWTAPDVSRGTVIFNAAANAANNNFAHDPGDHIYTTEARLDPAASSGPAPAVAANGTVNNASFAAGTNPLAPGTIAAIFGINLNDGSSNPSQAGFGPDGKLPNSLGGASVTFNGVPAPVFSSFAGQLNVMVPFEMAGVTQASVVVTANGQASAPQTVPIGPLSPGIFSVASDGKGQGAVQIANTTIFAAPTGSIAGVQARPARPGEFLTIYCTGLGDVSDKPATGAPAGSNPLSATVATPQVTIGGIPATVSFSGLAPGFVGLYQINAQVPAAVPAGDTVALEFTIGGIKSNPVTIAVGP